MYLDHTDHYESQRHIHVDSTRSRDDIVLHTGKGSAHRKMSTLIHTYCFCKLY